MKNPINISDYEYKLHHAQQAIGYQFDNLELLLMAITHPSALSRKNRIFSYERLEFLGDSLLGAYVAKVVYEKFPKHNEGDLTKLKMNLVSGENLSDIADKLGLRDSIILGTSEVNTNCRGLHSALENVYESICAAIYLDGGNKPLNEFLDRTLIVLLDDDDTTSLDNSKSKLQEVLQKRKMSPSYSIINEFGPAHNKQFVAEVMCEGKTLASGQGKTKKEAEINAAQAALNGIKNKNIVL